MEGMSSLPGIMCIEMDAGITQPVVCKSAHLDSRSAHNRRKQGSVGKRLACILQTTRTTGTDPSVFKLPEHGY